MGTEPIPPPPPSTKKTLVFPAVEIARPAYRPSFVPPDSSSDTGVIELSASALESVRDLEDEAAEDVAKPDLLARLVRGARKVHVSDRIVSRRAERREQENDAALRSLLADSVAPPAPRSSGRRVRSVPSLDAGGDRAKEASLAARAFALLPRWVIALVFARDAGARVAFALLVVLLLLAPSPPNVAQAREPRSVATERTTLVLARPDAFAIPGAGACAVAPAKTIAPRAWIGPGADVRGVDGGFGIGFVADQEEIAGVRLLGPALRVGEHVRERRGAWVRHVATLDGESDTLALHVDTDESRAITTTAGAFRIAGGGGWLLAIPERASERARVLWPLPWSGSGKVRASAPPPESIRVARTSDGGAVVAVKRPGVVWVGAIGADLSARGPLVPLARQSTAIGTPSLAATHDGGVIAWAEHAAGSADWQVMLATFSATPNEPPRMRAIANGMSPAIVTLADGDHALAYTTGAAGAHRVHLQRTTSELEPMGEPLAVSPEGVNAGQPAAAFGEDGRGVVAWFAADHHGASLMATPVACGL